MPSSSPFFSFPEYGYDHAGKDGDDSAADDGEHFPPETRKGQPAAGRMPILSISFCNDAISFSSSYSR